MEPRLNNDEELKFMADEQTTAADGDEPWKVLIADDDEDVHRVTEMVFRGFTFRDRKLLINDAYSGAEAVDILRADPSYAVLLLDVIMESQDAGLQTVKRIREELGLREIRIILRTGQPGTAPEATVVRQYDINDYQTKTELTNNRLVSVVTSALRTYDDMRTIAGMRDALELKVKERTHELEEMIAAKDQMFSIIAHDLRGPVSNVKGFLDLMVDTMEPHSRAEIDDYLRILHVNANATMVLLDNLLYWARSQRGLLETDLVPEELAPILREAIDINKGTAAAKGVVLELEVLPGLNCLMDANMIALVVRNLISNAIKFTALGGRVRIVAAEQDGLVTVSVADTGVGMSEGQLASLFDVHTHRSTFGTNNERGSGLGLLLCFDFAKRHGGDLQVKSNLGKGSTFTFTLTKSP